MVGTEGRGFRRYSIPTGKVRNEFQFSLIHIDGIPFSAVKSSQNEEFMAKEEKNRRCSSFSVTLSLSSITALNPLRLAEFPARSCRTVPRALIIVLRPVFVPL